MIYSTHGSKTDEEKTGNRQQSKTSLKLLKNNDPIHHTMCLQCFRLQLLLRSQRPTTVKELVWFWPRKTERRDGENR